MTSAGSVEAKGPQVFIRLDGAFDDLQKIRDTPLAVQGRTLKLSDVAEVKRGYEEPSTFMVRNNGEPALLLGIVMRDGWNGLDLGKALEAETTSINEQLPLLQPLPFGALDGFRPAHCLTELCPHRPWAAYS